MVTPLGRIEPIKMERSSLVQRTLFIIKPDAIRRNKVGDILNDLKASGLKLIRQKKINLPLETLKRLYEEHEGKDFYDNLIKYMTGGTVICAVVEGVDAIQRLRDLMGATIPSKAAPNTIRGKYRAESDTGPSGAIENLVHGSDRQERAIFEVGLLFGEDVTK